MFALENNLSGHEIVKKCPVIPLLDIYDICLHKNLYMSACGSITHSRLKEETTQTSAN
jgi:hypothetical protein